MSKEQPTETFSSGQRRLALVIGVNEAAQSYLPPLKHAIDDATKMAEVLHDACGFELFEPPLVGANATSANVKRAILAMARQRSDNDFLLLYFSGHGQPMTISGDQPDVYLVTHDFSEQDIEDDETLGFSMRWLQNRFYIPTQAGRVLLILDCCYAGNIGTTSTNPYLDDLKARIYKFFGQPMGSDEARKGGLRLALTATGHDQTAGEQDGYGLMTRHLVEVLQGNVDEVIELENQGKVSLQRIHSYLQRIMPATQNPSVSGDYAGKECILAQYAERATELHRQRQHTPVNERPNTYIPFRRKESFQPRPHEFENLERLLFPAPTGNTASSCVGLVGVIGMGGIGKTQLAVELAYRYKDRFPSGVFWMPATGKTLPEWQRQFAELAESTDYLRADDDITNPENEAKRARHLCRYLATHSDALLILDNVENTDLVLSALPALAGEEARCTVLYTSRNTLTPSMVKRHVVERLPEDGALNLLLTHKPALLPLVLQENTLDTEAQAARAICQYVDYLPLALTLLRDLLQDEYLTLVHLATQLQQRGTFEITRDFDETEARLFTTFQLSWEKITDTGAQRLFRLAAYFPEATAIPLWLLGLAAGLGETGNTRLEPLGRARNLLQKWSMIEGLEHEQIRLHPLIREFGRSLVSRDEQGTKTLQEAGQSLIAEFTDLNKLEQRAFAVGYWRCLEQVQQAYQYARILDTGNVELLGRIEQWIARDSSLLRTDEQLWPEKIPGLFYQLLYNHKVEAGYQSASTQQSAPWIRQREQVGIEDGTLLREFKHPDSVTCVAYSPNGRTIATGCEDGIARLWNIASGRTRIEFRGHTEGIFCLAFSPDGTHVATGSDDATTRVWDVTDGKQLHLLRGSIQALRSVAFSPNGERIVTTSEDGIGRVWDITSEEEIATLSRQDVRLKQALFTPDGKQIMSCSEHGAYIWDIQSEQVVQEMEVGPDNWAIEMEEEDLDDWAIETVLVYGTQLAAVCTNYSLFKESTKIVNIENQETLTQIYGRYVNTHSFNTVVPVFSLDKEKVILYSTTKQVALWDTHTSVCIAEYNHIEQVTSIAFSPNSQTIVISSEDKIARIWSIPSTQKMSTVKGWGNEIKGICFSSDRTTLAVKTLFDIHLRNMATGTEVSTISTLNIIAASMLFSPKNTYLTIYGLGIFIFDVQYERLQVIIDNLGFIHELCFSPDEYFIVFGTSSNLLIQIRNATNGEMVQQLEGHQGNIYQLAFSSDGTRLVSGSMDGTARIWDMQDYSTVAVLKNHVGGVTCLCISPDSKLVATASLDGVVHIWSMQDGKELALLKRRRIAPSSMAFSPDGSLLLVNDRYAYTSLWKMDSQGNGQLVGTYTTATEVKTLYWQDTRHVLLAAIDASGYEPQIYHLALEGEW